MCHVLYGQRFQCTLCRTACHDAAEVQQKWTISDSRNQCARPERSQPPRPPAAPLLGKSAAVHRFLQTARPI
eukprot:8685372-Alexandrium_andersonii.AAC.1